MEVGNEICAIKKEASRSGSQTCAVCAMGCRKVRPRQERARYWKASYTGSQLYVVVCNPEMVVFFLVLAC